MKMDPRMVSELLKAQLLTRSMNVWNTDPNQPLNQGTNSNSDMNSMLEFAMLMQQMTTPTDEVSPKIIENPVPEAKQPSPLLGQVQSFPTHLMKASTFEPIVQRSSEKWGVSTALIRAVMQAESSFNPQALSHSGAKGLMQLMDATAESVGVTDSYDPEQNILGGTRYLKGLLERFGGNEAVAVAAYNAGPNRVKSLGITDQATLEANYERLPEETQNYVQRVMKFKDQWMSQENLSNE